MPKLVDRRSLTYQNGNARQSPPAAIVIMDIGTE
jgi:hypothetical protein